MPRAIASWRRMRSSKRLRSLVGSMTETFLTAVWTCICAWAILARETSSSRFWTSSSRLTRSLLSPSLSLSVSSVCWAIWVSNVRTCSSNAIWRRSASLAEADRFDGLNKLRVKREELVSKRDELVSRAKMAQAQVQVQQTLKEVSVLDPTSELNRFEEKIRRQEAQARGMEEVAMSSLEDQFAELESGEDEIEVEVRLAELKGKQMGSGAPALGSGDSGV